jgi:choline transport protein
MVSHTSLSYLGADTDSTRWNCLAWIFGAASVSLFGANSIIAMYSVYHPDYVPQRWQVYICFLIITWSDLSLLLFGQRFIAKTFAGTGILLLLIFAVVTLVCAIMPSQNGHGYASNAFVWTDFENLTGWSSNGLVFVMGILNGAYAIGTPCAATHLAEEVC